MYRILATLTIVGLLLVITTAANAASALLTPIVPRAPDQEHHIYLPLVLYNYPPAPPLYRLYADPDDLDWLANQNPYQDETIPATFIYERSWDVDVRYRGDVSRLMDKKCWKVFFPGSDLFQGQGEMNLNADYPDQTLLRSYIGYDLFARAGVPAPRAGYARLHINDEYYGLFSQVEQVDERFLHRLGIEMHGNLYKPFYGNLTTLDYIEDPEEKDWWYRYYYPKKTNRQSGIDDVVAFIELINYTSDEQFPEAIAELLDVNGWLDWYAVNILIGNFEMLEKNYYIYHDFSTDRWLILPWDVDLSLGHNMWGPGVGGLLDEEISWDNPIDSGTQESKKIDGKWNGLIDRMMNVPEFRFSHCRRLKELMTAEFSPDEMFPRVDTAFTYIRPWAEADPQRWQPEGFQFSAGPDELKTYITNRIQFLETEMITFCPDLKTPLTVNEFMADNTSTIADEAGDYDDWIEIQNGSGTLAWDLGGMYLTDDLSDPTRWQIPTSTLVSPGGTLLLWADGEEGEGMLHTNFALDADGGQIGLFDRDVFGNAAISVLTYPAQATDVSYGRMPDGGEDWQFLTPPTPGWLNRGRSPITGDTAHTPAWPTSGDTVTVTTVITDEGTVTATLWYRAFAAGTEPPDYYQAVAMTAAATGTGSLFTGTIFTQTDGTRVEYYIEAEDVAGMVTVDRPGWPLGDYRYIVGWQRPPLYINELMALNTHTLEDGDGDHDDWIELYNGGPVDIDVGGMYLSDNIDQPDPEQLDDPHIYQLPPGTTVPAGGYLILWADGDGTGDHLSFKLSGAGEYVGLFDSQAHHYAPIDAVYFPPQTPDVSWGRFPDGSTGTTTSGYDAWHAMDIPTPGEPNLLLPPQFLEVTRTPLWPSAGEGVTVTAVITAGSPIISATLWYDGGSGFQAMPMEWRLEIGDWRIENGEWRTESRGGDGEDRVYTAYIPPQPEGTLVNYYLEAIDSIGQTTLHPPAAPTATHRYQVGYAPPTLLINEFLADNESVNQDEAGEYDDWVELYNGSAVTVTLDGMYLTDDLSAPTKWQFPAGTTIPPGGHLLVWCDEDAGQEALHANFKLNRDGEEIGLFADETHGNVPLDSVVFGPQQEDISYGRQPDGSDTWNFLDPPTPGASNG
ncbi:MAG: CotH kinase family protein [Chloroflexota bacterium]|nr:CotH kinase family protein [Chloroflexota bacterium]